jgi:tetratricopeptide (TPR) repeat protein
LAQDQVTLPLGDTTGLSAQTTAIPTWERWNDYGIGLLRAGDQGANKGELRAAAMAFARVEKLGRADGPLNLARVYFKEGRIDEAAAALQRAADFEPPPPPWSLAWYSALVQRELGQLDAAISTLEELAATRFTEARERGFDFSRDYRMLNELGRILFERARSERGESKKAARVVLLERAKQRFEQVLTIDPENVTAHYNLALVNTELGQTQVAEHHHALHEQYRPDDQAVERAVTLHRRHNPAANHAAEAVAVYDLQRTDSW